MRRSSIITATALLASAAALHAPALAQGGKKKTPPSDSHRSAAPALMTFGDEPLRIDQLGFTMKIPVGAFSRANSVGQRKSIQIVPNEADQLVDDKAWIINVTTPLTSNAKTTIGDSLKQIVSLLEKSYGVTDSQGAVTRTDAEVIEQTDNLVIQGAAAGRVYIRVPGQKRDTTVVKGYTVFNPSPKQFVILELVTPGAAFDRVRSTYETMVATASFKDAAEVAKERELAIATTQQIFDRLTDEDYLAAMESVGAASGEDSWQRLYIPDKSGNTALDRELGYRGVRFWKGQRGQINPDLAKNRWGDADKQEGYLARLSLRVIDDTAMGVQVGNKAPAAVFIDSVGFYFMSLDRKEEAWSVRLVKRDAAGNELGRWTETAARVGNEVTVAVGDPKDRSRPVAAPFRPEGYIGQFESFLLPRFLVRHAMKNKLDDLESGAYSYRTACECVAFRRDTLRRDADGTGWTLETQVRHEPISQTYVFDAKGELVRTLLPEGRVWEPVEISDLIKLWREKGLPTETAGGGKRKK